LLSDREILQCLKFRGLKIKPFDPSRLGPVSYDITTDVQDFKNKAWRLVSKERFTLPKDLAGLVSLRSRTSKMDLFASFSQLVDPGYSGHLLFLIYNPAYPETLTEFKDLFQIMFFKVGKVNVAYNERKTSTAMDRKGF